MTLAAIRAHVTEVEDEMAMDRRYGFAAYFLPLSKRVTSMAPTLLMGQFKQNGVARRAKARHTPLRRFTRWTIARRSLHMLPDGDDWG